MDKPWHGNSIHSLLYHPWAGHSRTRYEGSTSCSVMTNDCRVKTDNDNRVLDIAIENSFYRDSESRELAPPISVSREIINAIEINTETGAAATAKVSGLCPVPNIKINNAKAVSAGAIAYRKANAPVLACSQVSNVAVAPRAATAHENQFLNSSEIVKEFIPSFESRKPRVSEAVSAIKYLKTSKEDNSNAYEKSLVTAAFPPVLSEIREAFATAMLCFSPGKFKGISSKIEKKERQA